MGLDLPGQSILLNTPFGRFPIEKRRVNPTIQFVQVHRVNAALKCLVLGLEPRECDTLTAAFMPFALSKRFGCPVQHFAIEP